MKKLLLAFLLLSASAFAQNCIPSISQTCTPNEGFALPALNSGNWNVPYNANWSLADTLFNNIFNGQATIPNLKVAGLNNVVYIDGVKYACSDAGITAAMITLTSGGIIDARGCVGTMTWSNTIIFAQPIVLYLGLVNVTVNGSPGVNMNSCGASIIGQGRGISILTAGVNADMIQANCGSETIRDIELEGASLASNIGIHIVAGADERISRVYANAFGGPAVQYEPSEGEGSVVESSRLQTVSTSVPAILINGTDGGTAFEKHFRDIETGGDIINVNGANNVMVQNCFLGGLQMSSASSKVQAIGNRIINNGVTLHGTNQVFTGNAVAGVITIASDLNNSVVGPNVDVGGYSNSLTASAGNVIVDNAGIGGVPQLVGTASFVAQTANISPATLYTTTASGQGSAGTYRVCFTALTTTSGTGTTSTVTVGWTDVAAKTFTSGTFALNSTGSGGQVNGCQVIHSAASQAITVGTASGTYGTSAYELDATVEWLR